MMKFYFWQWRWYRKRKGGTWIYTDVRTLNMSPFWQPLEHFDQFQDTGMEKEVRREIWI